MTGRRLHVVSQRRWLADEFSGPARLRGYGVELSSGLDLPRWNDGDAVWATLGWLAHAQESGWAVYPQSPGPKWLSGLPFDFLGRGIISCRLGDLPRGKPGYVKLAEVKMPGLRPAWYEDVEQFVTRARGIGVSDDAVVNCADRRLDIEVEVRCFIAQDIVTSVAAYRYRETWWDAGMPNPDVDSPFSRAAYRFARSVLAEIGPERPEGWVLDVCCTKDGQWLVMEANPAFSAHPYDCDPLGVVDSVIAAASASDRWRWIPDPTLIANAKKKPLLRHA